MSFTDKDLARLKEDLPSHQLCCLGGIEALVARLEKAEDTVGSWAAGHSGVMITKKYHEWLHSKGEAK